MSKQAHGHDTKHHKLPMNRCFGCGPDNSEGMRLRFRIGETGKSFICHFKLSRRYTGPPGHAHGGIIATILDEAMGKVNKLRNAVALTSEMTVNYLRPVPLGKKLTVEGWEKSIRGRVHTNVAEIRTESGEVLARGLGKFVEINPRAMFDKYLRNTDTRKK